MIKLFLILISLFNLNTSKSEPVRLQKKEDSIQLDSICRKICPYVLIACVIIISVLLFVVLVRYGHAFSTEANHYEHLTQITTG